MARWEKEDWISKTPPEDIQCKGCKYAMPPAEVDGKKYERYTFAICEKYKRKPREILWEHAKCEYRE